MFEMKRLSYKLWDEDEQTHDDRDDGRCKDGAGGEVFDNFYFGVPLFCDVIRQSFDAGVDHFGDPDKARDDGEDGRFGGGDL